MISTIPIKYSTYIEYFTNLRFEIHYRILCCRVVVALRDSAGRHNLSRYQWLKSYDNQHIHRDVLIDKNAALEVYKIVETRFRVGFIVSSHPRRSVVRQQTLLRTQSAAQPMRTSVWST